MRKYNVALIGCGQMGEAHLDYIYYKENVYIKYVCDKNIEKAQLLQRKFGAKYAVSEAEQCILDTDVDVIIIATYPKSHVEILKLCLENGKHVLCEKPIAESPEQVENFCNLVRAHAECKVLVGHILRYNATYNKVAELIQDDVIGSPIVMRMVQNHHAMNWERYKELICQTSPIIDCGTHYFDVMRWFTGEEIVEVSGIGQCLAGDLPEGKYDYGLVTLKLSGGSVGYYEAGWSNTTASENIKEFVGPKGRIKIVYSENRTSHSEEGDLIEIYRFPERTYEILNVKGKRKPTDIQFEYLLEMIEKNVPAKPTLEDVYESARWTFKADDLIRP